MGTQGKTKFKDTSVDLIDLEQTGGKCVGQTSSVDGYSGIGTATLGAPRVFWGENTPSGDDSCHLLVRRIEGEDLYSHGIRDESTFESETDGAYCSFDASPEILEAANHAASFQSRIIYNSSGHMGEMAGFVFGCVAAQGSIDNVYGFRIRDVQIQGGASVALMAGIWIDTIAGATANYGIYVAGNNSYLGGNLQINGLLQGVSELTASGKVLADDGIGVGNSAAASTLGSVVKKMQVFDATGNAIGYVPIYDDIT